MARQYELEDLMGKTSNDGSTDAGRLTHVEWNDLIDIISEIKGQATGAIKGILWKPDASGEGGVPFTEVDNRGYLKLNPPSETGDVAIYIDERPDAYIASDSDCIVKFHVASKIQQGETSVPAENACDVSFFIDNGSGKDILVGKSKIYDYEYALPGATKSLEFNFANISNAALATGDIENKLTIEVNNGYGKIVRSIIMVRVINLSMRVENFDVRNVYNEANPPQVKVTVYGSDANVFAEVDGVQILSGGKASQGITTTFNTNIFTDNNVNTHGVHTIKLWASVTKDLGNNESVTISTQTVEYNYIYGGTVSDPIVMANIANKNPEQYTTFNISYIAYKYNSTNAIVSEEVRTSIYEYSENEGEISLGRELIYTTQIVDFNSSTNSAENTASLSLFPVTLLNEETNELEEIDIIGPMAVVISIGDYKYVDYINIKESSIKLSEIPGYAVKLSSSGRSNGETTTLKEWKSIGEDTQGNILEVDMLFDDNIEFTETGSGWIYDGDKYDANDPNDRGNVAMRLRKGRYCTLDYNPFKVNPTYASENNRGTGNGMTISIEFATRNSLNQNATVISCLENDTLGRKKGFEVLANKATIYSNNVELYADFKEDTRIKLDFVIDGKQWPYTTEGFYYLDENEEKVYQEGETTNEALCIIYVDGVYQALATIPANTSFMQSLTGVPIRFGSDECDIDIYNIRIYDQALTPNQIIQNYAYDTPNVKNKLAIARRNHNVLDVVSKTPQRPNINIEALRVARPDLPFFYVEMDATEDPTETLPQDKSTWKLLKMTQYKNPKNDSSLSQGNPSFEIENAVLRNQGTSSMTYPWPWRNWDWKTKDGDYPQGKGVYSMPTIANPEVTSSYWPQYLGMHNISSGDGKGNLKKITLKKDYASSEMCNNAITSEMFTDMANGIGDARPGVLSPAQRFNGGGNSPYRLTFKATPCFMFRKYSDPLREGTAGKGYEALGMMNLIPNKNECAYLGFFGNYTWENNRSQSWELSDNYPEKFWKVKLNGVRYISQNEHTNDIDGLYEARYPKDSTVIDDADFGMTKGNIDTTQEADIRDEQQDLIDFHNWLVATNRQIPVEYKEANGEYQILSPEDASAEWNIDQSGRPIDDRDTPDYRLRKFKAEAPDRMIIDQFAMYYIWREVFWAYDSGFKNLQIYTMGPNPDKPENGFMQWGCMVRDADTTLGIQNQGRIEFPPYLEDTDYYVENNGVKTYYFDALKNSYDEADINKLGGKHVLNGQLGSLWINLRDAFADKIQDVYTLLHQRSSSTNWSSTRAIKRFRDHQEKWCESLYNFGMRQYYGGSQFTKWINSGLGDKKNSRASWLEKAFYYRDSKYRVHGANDYAAFRAGCYYTPDIASGTTETTPLKFKLYQQCYLTLGDNEVKIPNGYKSRRRITDVSDYIDVMPVADLNFPLGTSSAMNVHYGTSNMIEIGDFARVCKLYEIQAWNFPKLKSLLLGHEPARDGVTYYEYITDANGNSTNVKVPISNNALTGLDLSSFKQLQVLDITNHSSIGNIDASYCTELRELYARGCTSTSAINLPNTTTLNTLYLPSTITSINLNGLSGLTDFVLDAPETGSNYAIELLNITNCGDYMASESYNIVSQVIDSLERVYIPGEINNICTLTNVNWENAEAALLERLLNIDATLSGKIVIKGLSNDLKVKLSEKYGNIDDPNNSLYIEYIQTPITAAKLPNKMYIYTPGEHKLTFSVTPTTANTYKSATWSLSANRYATINSETGVITRNDEPGDENTSATLTLTIKQIPEYDGTVRNDLTVTSTIYFYERLARPGDIVFNDGTFSDELDSAKTPIGVCFYVDPTDKTKRLMCALDNVKISNTSRICWGVYNTGGHIDAQTGSNDYYYGSNPNLKIEGYNCYDIAAINNFNVAGPATGGTNTIYFSDSIYRDETNEANHFFKAFAPSEYYGDLGWKMADSNIKIDKLQLPNNETSIEITQGDNLPSGYYNTLAIIHHRNRLLDNYYNAITGDFKRPDNNTNPALGELYWLGQYMSNANKADYAGWENSKAGTGGTYGSHLYYPAASACFAYEPNVSNLDNKFKKYNWFLPASGDLVRLMYYCHQSVKSQLGGGVAVDEPTNSMYDSSYQYPANAFTNAINILGSKFVLSGLSGGYGGTSYSVWSSTENTAGNAVVIESQRGSWSNENKHNSNYARPVCAF